MVEIDNPLSVENIIDLLQDENRLSIFMYILVNHKVTLKQLSDQLEKGKTTVHHHIRKLEKAGIINWEEKEDDKRKLKTRYYSINNDSLFKSFTFSE
ncbi:MAG: ArsR/SmtB family transcription factor [Candidatus Hodarchaeales archaeon]|jgi:DNA-binding MarR family transcriptional regulator